MQQNQDDLYLQQARTMSQKLGKSLKVLKDTPFAILWKLLAYYYQEYISFWSVFWKDEIFLSDGYPICWKKKKGTRTNDQAIAKKSKDQPKGNLKTL